MLAKVVGLTALLVAAETYKPYEYLRDVVTGNRNCYRLKHRELNLSRNNMGITTPLLRPKKLHLLDTEIDKQYDELCELSDPDYYASFRSNVTLPRPPNTLYARFSPTNFVSREILWEQEETNAQKLVTDLRKFVTDGETQIAAIELKPKRFITPTEIRELKEFLNACKKYAQDLEATCRKLRKKTTLQSSTKDSNSRPCLASSCNHGIWIFL